jgi:hypothetical protein
MSLLEIFLLTLGLHVVAGSLTFVVVFVYKGMSSKFEVQGRSPMESQSRRVGRKGNPRNIPPRIINLPDDIVPLPFSYYGPN